MKFTSPIRVTASKASRLRHFPHLVSLKLRGGNVDSVMCDDDSGAFEDGEFWEGGVISWGINCHGRLGNGGSRDRHRPARTKLLEEVVQICAGDYHR